MNKVLEKIKGDRAIWMVVIFLSIFSLLAVYSSTGTLAYKYRSGNTEYYIIKHFIIMLLGLGLMLLASRIKYTYYSRISQLALWVAAPLLLLTLVRGTNINEASRWLTLPIINISFQSSDFAKLALIMYVARMLTKKQETIKDFKEAFMPVLVPVLIITMLILPANLSTAAILFVTCAILMFIGGVNIKYLAAFGGIGLLSLLLFVFVASKMPESRVSVWGKRVTTFVTNTGDTYQTQQAKIAIASGGAIGKMPGNSTQRNFLPHAYSDFIYAIIIEEYGFVGGFFVLLLYLILFYRAIKISKKSPGTFGALLVAGLSFSLVFQGMINMAVAVNIFPVTGQPLPLISMGGTSLWFSSLAIGIILSVSRKVEEDELNGRAITTS
ncbi:MAG: FtsW/RodA/SpoVE family cell cycle protein [Bacteroidales bacterium]|nr:FtsW/RodA/SpoVE family cell cycle protein [Bacteroidales bacterium]